jgi:acetylglutamate kinase
VSGLPKLCSHLSSKKMDKLNIIKVGGEVIDDEIKLQQFLADFAGLTGHKILIHGGGKLATRLAGDLNIKQEIIEGRRITDADTLRIVTMVYAGWINKSIVAQLQSMECNAIGVTGADAGLIVAHKRIHPTIDYGFVGEIDTVNALIFKEWLDYPLTIVVAPITSDQQGQLLNTNADTIASEIAKALAQDFETSLVFCFDKPGVLLDVNDNESVVNSLDKAGYQQLKNPATGKSRIFAGMIPKLDNAFVAIENGVRKVIIGRAEDLPKLLHGGAGTTISNE